MRPSDARIPCRAERGRCLTHNEDLVCPHACPHGVCRSGCEDMTDRELKRAAGGAR
jgi:hypothetical protein